MKKINVVLLLLLISFVSNQTKAKETQETVISLTTLMNKKSVKHYLIDITKVHNPRLFKLINDEPNCLELLQLVYHITKSTKPVILKFYADWCGPCKRMNPTIKRVAERFNNQVSIITIDIDRYKQVSNMFHISHVPTLIFFKRGLETKRANVMSEQQLVEAINELL